ncbi:MAG TPA: hydroxymyristoyl-ACP dehydratase [Geomonas sp.]|nr:hydroxymyristoyl-ACP dehydratase [Geomonas sp.]
MAILFHPDPCSYLPHRHPFLFVDRILSLEPGVVATGELGVTGEHYFPPVLLVEAIAQLGGIAAGQKDGEGGVLAGFRDVQLPPRVLPGEKLLITCKVIKIFGPLVQVEGEVSQGGEVLATATVTLAMTAGSQP